jgi:hypothetical protein
MPLRSACLLVLLAAIACSRAPGAERSDRASLQAGVDSAANRLLSALRTNGSDSLMALMADDVVLMPPNEAALKGKAAVRAWYDQLLTQLRTSNLTIADREVLIGGEWPPRSLASNGLWYLSLADPRPPTEAAMCRSGTMSRMDGGSSPASCGTARPRL